MTMKECVEFLGLSRSTIAKNIALTKKKKMTPPFPFVALFGGEKRQKYFFDKVAQEDIEKNSPVQTPFKEDYGLGKQLGLK